MDGPHMPQLPQLPRPRLRGRLHQVAFFVSIPAGLTLVALARDATARAAAVVFAVTLSALYGVSAAYHRRNWSARAHRVMKHLDHSMIFVFIAGSYTPVTLLALRPSWGVTLLILAWSGAALGVLVTVLRLERWHGVGFAMYLLLGWLGAIATPQLLASLSAVELTLLVVGGVLYTVGAVVLARKRPDPNPKVFGYHEVWHTFVVGANVCHFLLVLSLVLGA
ncbi:MAG TPA: hemolysin III family protein [Acidimicrobiales bacterium]